MKTLQRLIAVTAVFVLSVSVAQPADAGLLRSGRIIGWFFAMAPNGAGCESSVECTAWFVSGCNPRLAGHDPALHSSIVDVSSLAGSRRTRVLRVHKRAPWLVWAGLRIELWAEDCWHDATLKGPVQYQTSFKIAEGVRWMTLTSADSTTVRWELR